MTEPNTDEPSIVEPNEAKRWIADHTTTPWRVKVDHLDELAPFLESIRAGESLCPSCKIRHAPPMHTG